VSAVVPAMATGKAIETRASPIIAERDIGNPCAIFDTAIRPDRYPIVQDKFREVS
jgi:hypothetical protein